MARRRATTSVQCLTPNPRSTLHASDQERVLETLMAELKSLPKGRSVYAAPGSVGCLGSSEPGKVLVLTDRRAVERATRKSLQELDRAKQEHKTFMDDR